jgi:hypothetical protein
MLNSTCGFCVLFRIGSVDWSSYSGFWSSQTFLHSDRVIFVFKSSPVFEIFCLFRGWVIALACDLTTRPLGKRLWQVLIDALNLDSLASLLVFDSMVNHSLVHSICAILSCGSIANASQIERPINFLGIILVARVLNLKACIFHANGSANFRLIWVSENWQTWFNRASWVHWNGIVTSFKGGALLYIWR